MQPIQQRGLLRRRTIVEAAASVLREEGLAACTHRRVAAVAGVPLGSLTYYFFDREALVHAGAAELFAQERDRRAQLRGRAGNPRAAARALTRLLVSGRDGQRAATRNLYALRLHAGADEPLRELTAQDDAELHDLAARLLGELGLADRTGAVLAIAHGRVLHWLGERTPAATLDRRLAADLELLGRPAADA